MSGSTRQRRVSYKKPIDLCFGSTFDVFFCLAVEQLYPSARAAHQAPFRKIIISFDP